MEFLGNKAEKKHGHSTEALKGQIVEYSFHPRSHGKPLEFLSRRNNMMKAIF